MTELPELDRLIDVVVEDAASEEPLVQLGAAARARDELDALTEALLDHFVEQARSAGCSWSQIGSALGVSKQAAQQRHAAPDSVARRMLARLSGRRPSGGGLFTRFTSDARTTVVLAREEAARQQHNYIGTEHLLLGLLAKSGGIAGQALAELGITEEAVRNAVIEKIGHGPEEVRGHIPFTPRSKKVLELSLREAIRLGHDRIGTEDILLGILREGEGLAVEVLTRLGADRDRVRETVMRLLEEAP